LGLLCHKFDRESPISDTRENVSISGESFNRWVISAVGRLVYDVGARYSARERRRSSREDEIAYLVRRVEEHSNVERRLPGPALDEHRAGLRVYRAIADTAR